MDPKTPSKIKLEYVIGGVIVLILIGAFGFAALHHPDMSAGGPITFLPATATSTASTTPGAVPTQEIDDSKDPAAPELVSPDAYINTGGQPISIGQYKGKDVVLIDFWTYSCINCIRTLPYVEAWYTKYKDQGLVVIGVHTPEFSFEHILSNVEAAVTRLGITYPVILDNEYATWNAFGNEYWPRHYLIDVSGKIVYDHIGEGDYDVTEKAIQAALADRAARLGITENIPSSLVNVADNTPEASSPETYFGSARNEYLGNGSRGVAGTQSFTLPAMTTFNTLYLGGSWDIEDQYAEGGPGTEIVFPYDAQDVYLVGAGNPSATIEVLRDGVPVSTVAGSDVDPKTGQATLTGNRLYTLIQDTTPDSHSIEIKVLSGKLDAFTFTFG